uniref:NADH-ubiquinone oxidoreductase chain 4 n=1 Tax=Capillidium heterosporum TaxID=1167838 RepID=A0A3S5HWR8_9FUNG|nr:NADH dehydrogenase subunit 4 [Capillidium heterosporum]AZZ06717.1 NADH dehydrogenase subunit 4 [Capillidium heterosporum]
MITSNVVISKIIGLISSLVVLVIYGIMWGKHNSNNNYLQIIENDNSYYPLSMGIDSISLYMIGITIILIPICILSTWSSVKENVKLYLVLLLGLEAILILVFVLLDILLFYITFESSLIPMYLIIGIYGSRERKIYAAYQFFLITLLGSLLMLMGIIILYSQIGVTDYQILAISNISKEREYLLWLALFISFAVKTPLVPFHLWLPEAHSEANIAGSIILAGVLLKLAGYGLIRYSINILPEGSIYFIPLVYGLSVISIIYSSLTTLRQIDMKKIIAYSSIGHMGIVLLGIFSYSIEGIEGSIILMIGHGLVSPGLFMIVTVLYDRYHSRIIKYYRGVVVTSPLLAIVFFILTLSNMAVPLTSNFVGELLCFMGAFQTNPIATILATTGIILGGAYSIWFYNRIVFGERSVYLREIEEPDMNRREWSGILPLLILIMIIGIYPNIILETLHVAVSNIFYSIKLKGLIASS